MLALRRIRRAPILLLCVWLSSCDLSSSAGSANTASERIKIRLLTDWVAEPEHGGFYLALAKGYYRDAGMDVEIIPVLGGLSVLVQMIAADQAEFAMITSDNLIVAADRGMPIVGLFPYFQHDPQGIMVHNSSDVQSFEDLDGREVMISPGLHYVEVIQRLLGIKLNILPMNYGISRFIQNEDFIQQAFLTSEPYFAMQAGAEPRLLPFWETGLDPYRLIYSKKQFVDKNPQITRQFINVSMRGWQEFMAGETQIAFDAIVASNNQQTPAFMQWTYAQMQYYDIVEGDQPLGHIDLKRLSSQVEQLRQLELINRDIQVEEFMWLEFYPEELLGNEASELKMDAAEVLSP